MTGLLEIADLVEVSPLGGTIIEVGAGDGRETQWIADNVLHTRMLAFESDPARAVQLAEGLVGYPSVTAYNAVVSNRSGMVMIDGVPVRVIELDSLGLEDVTLIRVTVRDARSILAGAQQTILRWQPLILHGETLLHNPIQRA